MSLLGLNDPAPPVVEDVEADAPENEGAEADVDVDVFAAIGDRLAALEQENQQLRQVASEAVGQAKVALELLSYQPPAPAVDLLAEFAALREELLAGQLAQLTRQVAEFRKELVPRPWWRRLFRR